MSENVLVTGGSGFIGSWVLRELFKRGARPVVYDLQRGDERWERILDTDAARVVFVEGDLTDIDQLSVACREHAITHVIHLGALLTPACQSDPWLGCQVNVLGSVAVFEQARLNPQRIKSISFASSLAVYGPEPDDVVRSSDIDTTHTPSFYGAYKRSVELIARQYWQHFGIGSFGLRPHVVYGPERHLGLTAGPSLAARAAALGEAFTIDYSGPAGYDYVEDVARAFVRGAFETPEGSNVVDLPSVEATTDEMVATINELVPESHGQLTTRGEGIPSNTPANWHLISELFPDWSATSLQDGLRKTIEFYR